MISGLLQREFHERGRLMVNEEKETDGEGEAEGEEREREGEREGEREECKNVQKNLVADGESALEWNSSERCLPLSSGDIVCTYCK